MFFIEQNAHLPVVNKDKEGRSISKMLSIMTDFLELEWLF